MKDLQGFSRPIISPSLLAADKNKIPSMILLAKNSGADFIHIDCMDGRFVPNFAYDDTFVEKYHSPLLVNDVHIMIAKPWLLAESYCEKGADILTFHLEACPDEESVFSLIAAIRSFGVHPGLSIKPATPALKLLPFLSLVDLVLVMSVEPGKGGQSFLPTSLTKIAFLRHKIDVLPQGKRPLIEVDGGINDVTGPECVKEGADVLVAGSYLYGHEDFAERLAKLRR